jgi:hypothetical protein
LSYCINTVYVAGAAFNPVFATETSHVSGFMGLSVRGSAPGSIIFVPLVEGVFFDTVERLAADTPAQPILILARDACLITSKIAEIAYSEKFIGPVLRQMGIDAKIWFRNQTNYNHNSDTYNFSNSAATCLSLQILVEI